MLQRKMEQVKNSLYEGYGWHRLSYAFGSVSVALVVLYALLAR